MDSLSRVCARLIWVVGLSFGMPLFGIQKQFEIFVHPKVAELVSERDMDDILRSAATFLETSCRIAVGQSRGCKFHLTRSSKVSHDIPVPRRDEAVDIVLGLRGLKRTDFDQKPLPSDVLDAVENVLLAGETGNYTKEAVAGLIKTYRPDSELERPSMPAKLFLVRSITEPCPNTDDESEEWGCTIILGDSMVIAVDPTGGGSEAKQAGRSWSSSMVRLYSHEIGHLLGLHDHGPSGTSQFLMSPSATVTGKVRLLSQEVNVLCAYPDKAKSERLLQYLITNGLKQKRDSITVFSDGRVQ